MKKFTGFEKGMGIGGWLTNYKRFNVLPDEWRLPITDGDMEHFATYITEQDVKYIAKCGFDHIRLGFDQIVMEKSPFVYREETFLLIENFVKWATKYGLNVVLNLHKAIGNYCDIQEDTTIFDDETLKERFVALWMEFERRFSSDNGVCFEILNEVRDVDPNAWNDLSSRVVTAIRKVNKERKIIIGSTDWNSANKLKDLILYDDENVIYTFHVYEPFEFTHQQGVLQKLTLYYNKKLTYPCDDVDRYADYYKLIGKQNPYEGVNKINRKVMEKILAPAVEFVKSHPDKILWCGEFGTIRHADITSRENWMADVISILTENEIPYCVWNYLSTPNDGNRFSLVDDDTRKFVSKRMLRICVNKH